LRDFDDDFFKVLIIENGAYGQRMVKICRILNIPHDVVSFNETERVKTDIIADKLKSNTYTHVAIIHCETSSGILNPIEEIGQLVYDHGTNKGLLSLNNLFNLRKEKDFLH
jgi:2-aminoethylphosphonate-pyruvate transaminase